jgi:hypothetical protein
MFFEKHIVNRSIKILVELIFEMLRKHHTDFGRVFEPSARAEQSCKQKNEQ